MPYVATFTPPDAAPLLLVERPSQAGDAKRTMRIEREPLAPSKPDGMEWKQWREMCMARLASQPVDYIGEFTIPQLQEDAKFVTIKENAEDDDDTADQYIVLYQYFPKGHYTFHDRNVHQHIYLYRDSPATQEEFEVSYRKLLENPRVKEGWMPLKKPEVASEACCVQ
eukprot:762677-Rhodomonas_salina.1